MCENKVRWLNTYFMDSKSRRPLPEQDTCSLKVSPLNPNVIVGCNHLLNTSEKQISKSTNPHNGFSEPMSTNSQKNSTPIRHSYMKRYQLLGALHGHLTICNSNCGTSENIY